VLFEHVETQHAAGLSKLAFQHREYPVFWFVSGQRLSAVPKTIAEKFLPLAESRSRSAPSRHGSKPMPRYEPVVRMSPKYF